MYSSVTQPLLKRVSNETFPTKEVKVQVQKSYRGPRLVRFHLVRFLFSTVLNRTKYVVRIPWFSTVFPRFSAEKSSENENMNRKGM